MSQPPQPLQGHDDLFAGQSAISVNVYNSSDVTSDGPVTVVFDAGVQPPVLLLGARLPEKNRIFNSLCLRIAIAEGQAASRGQSRSGDNTPAVAGEEKFACGRSGIDEQTICPSLPGTGGCQFLDPLIGELSDALAAAERAGEQHSRIYADAVRLAIVIRQLGRSDAQRSARSDEATTCARQVRALQKWRLRRVTDHMANHLSSKISLADLAAVAGLSRMHFASQFRVATGLRPHEYLLRLRIRRAEELLRLSTEPVVQIALAVGFQTQPHFTSVFKRIMGHTPCQWRHVHENDGLAANERAAV